MFGSLRWTNQNLKNLESKEPIDTTAITDPAPNLHLHLTPQRRGGPVQLGQLPLEEEEVKVFQGLLQTRVLQESTIYPCPLYLGL